MATQSMGKPRSKRQTSRANSSRSSRTRSRRSTSARRSSGSPRASSARLGSRSRARGGSQSRSSAAAQSTKNLEDIRAWAEARGGKPATVKATRGRGTSDGAGILRIDFPGYSGAGSLEEISWEEWYQKFQENDLTFLYQEHTKDGRESRFFKLVCEPAKSSAKSGASRRRASR